MQQNTTTRHSTFHPSHLQLFFTRLKGTSARKRVDVQQLYRHWRIPSDTRESSHRLVGRLGESHKFKARPVVPILETRLISLRLAYI